MNDATSGKTSMVLLSQTLSSQLCHDMASPIGALLAGIELLPGETPQDTQEVLAVLQNTGCILKNRLEMLRAAFTIAGQTLGAQQAKTLISEYVALHEKIAFFMDWPLGVSSVQKGALQILLNLLMWTTQKIPKGGTLKIALTPLQITLHLTSKMIFFRPEDAGILQGHIAFTELHPQNVQAYFIHLLATTWNYFLEIQQFSQQELKFCLHLEKIKELNV